MLEGTNGHARGDERHHPESGADQRTTGEEQASGIH